jgi:hypothetical protein
VVEAMNILGNCDVVGVGAKFLVAFPLTYHYVAGQFHQVGSFIWYYCTCVPGMRHIAWDHQPDTTLNNDSVQNTSYAIIGASVAIAGAAALL